MKYIALTGGIATGKTAVAQELVRRGYLLISYTDLLKQLLAEALSAIGVPTTLDTILADKDRYRALLQEFGTVIGFDEGDTYIHQALHDWYARGRPPAVFDNVRTDPQAEGIQLEGFTIVETRATMYARLTRLVDTGRDPQKLLTLGQHRVERGVADHLVDLHIDTDTMNPARVADFLETLPVEEITHD